jgi:hypothetical protein
LKGTRRNGACDQLEQIVDRFRQEWESISSNMTEHRSDGVKKGIHSSFADSLIYSDSLVQARLVTRLHYRYALIHSLFGDSRPFTGSIAPLPDLDTSGKMPLLVFKLVMLMFAVCLHNLSSLRRSQPAGHPIHPRAGEDLSVRAPVLQMAFVIDLEQQRRIPVWFC